MENIKKDSQYLEEEYKEIIYKGETEWIRKLSYDSIREVNLFISDLIDNKLCFTPKNLLKSYFIN